MKSKLIDPRNNLKWSDVSLCTKETVIILTHSQIVNLAAFSTFNVIIIWTVMHESWSMFGWYQFTFESFILPRQSCKCFVIKIPCESAKKLNLWMREYNKLIIVLETFMFSPFYYLWRIYRQTIDFAWNA